MSINQNLLNALLLQYRGKALASHAAIEELLKCPSGDGVVEDITRHVERLYKYETMMNTLKTYFSQSSASPAPEHPQEERKVSPEVSPTYRKSVQAQAVKKAKKKKTTDDVMYREHHEG